jgi:UDP-N-acetyl-D-mannosaminuronate dehydrogenase
MSEISPAEAQSKFKDTICCIGAGYVGGPTMAVIASHCPDIKVIVADIDKRKIDAWNSDICPIYEPKLQEYIVKYRGVNLFFTTDVADAIRESSIIFIAVNTPTKDFGHWVSYIINYTSSNCCRGAVVMIFLHMNPSHEQLLRQQPQTKLLWKNPLYQ